MPPKTYLLDPTNCSGADIENFIDGCYGRHFGHGNGTILAIKNRHVDPMPLIKYQLNLTFRSEGDVV